MFEILKSKILIFSSFCIVGLTSISPIVNSAIYRWQDKNGDLHFSDVPRPGAQEIKLQEAQSYNSPQATDPASNISDKNKKADPSEQIKYKTVEVSYPSHKQTLKNNTGIIQVKVKIEPELAENNMIQFFYDGIASGSPQTLNTHEVNNVNRGVHTVSANIIDESSNVVAKTSTITFYMQRPLVSQNPNLTQNIPSQRVIAPATQVVK